MTKKDIGLTLFFGAVIIGIVWDPFIGSFIHRSRNRTEVRTLYDAIRPGMARSDAERETKSGRYPHLTFYYDEDTGWVVVAPYEFGAKNWMLLIDVAAGRVTRLRVRTGDSINEHPADAPPDKPIVGAPEKESGSQ